MRDRRERNSMSILIHPNSKSPAPATRMLMLMMPAMLIMSMMLMMLMTLMIMIIVLIEHTMPHFSDTPAYIYSPPLTLPLISLMLNQRPCSPAPTHVQCWRWWGFVVKLGWQTWPGGVDQKKSLAEKLMVAIQIRFARRHSNPATQISQSKGKRGRVGRTSTFKLGGGEGGGMLAACAISRESGGTCFHQPCQ